MRCRRGFFLMGAVGVFLWAKYLCAQMQWQYAVPPHFGEDLEPLFLFTALEPGVE